MHPPAVGNPRRYFDFQMPPVGQTYHSDGAGVRFLQGNLHRHLGGRLGPQPVADAAGNAAQPAEQVGQRGARPAAAGKGKAAAPAAAEVAHTEKTG